MNDITKEDLECIASHDLPWTRLDNKTVLISGANGFLPSYLAETLLFLNDKGVTQHVKVIAVCRNRANALRRFNDYSERDDFTLLIHDINTPLKIDNEIDYIIHAASQASPKYFQSDPVGTLLPNTIGTSHLLNLARQKEVDSFLFFSSAEVYGEMASDKIPTAESDYGYLDPTAVRSCYAESKKMGETMCVSWHHQFGVPTKIVRPFHTYGPGLSLDDGRVFADFVSDIVHKKDIVMTSDGKATRAFCYIADATAAFYHVLLLGSNGEAYNVGTETEISIADLADLLVNLFPELDLKIIRESVKDLTNYSRSKISRTCPDTTKIQQLGWAPTHSLKDGFKRTIRSYL